MTTFLGPESASDFRAWLRPSWSTAIAVTLTQAHVLTLAAANGTMWTVDLHADAAAAMFTIVASSHRKVWAAAGSQTALKVSRTVSLPVDLFDWIRCADVLRKVLEPDAVLKGWTAAGLAKDVARMNAEHPLSLRQIALRSCRADLLFRPIMERGWELDVELLGREQKASAIHRAAMEGVVGLDLTRDVDQTRVWLKANGITLTDKNGAPSLSRNDFKRVIVEPGNEEAWKTYQKARSLKGSMAVLKGAAATHLRGVVRTDIHVHGAATGRMTTTGTESYQMNLLNVPRKLRGLLMAPEGMVLVSLDYAAAEIRIAASLSGERGLIDLLSSGVDPYLWLGVKRFGQEAVDADPDIRDKLKKALVSTLYGSGTRSLAAALGVDEKAAKGLTDALRSEWPTLFAFIARVSQEAAAGVRPVSGGGRPLPMTVEGKDYTRMNHLCQSTGADYLYAGLELVAERLGRDSIFLCVHDEVVVAVRPEQAQYAALVLKECMTFELPNGVMLTGEASVGGRSWSK